VVAAWAAWVPAPVLRSAWAAVCSEARCLAKRWVAAAATVADAAAEAVAAAAAAAVAAAVVELACYAHRAWAIL